MQRDIRQPLLPGVGLFQLLSKPGPPLLKLSCQRSELKLLAAGLIRPTPELMRRESPCFAFPTPRLRLPPVPRLAPSRSLFCPSFGLRCTTACVVFFSQRRGLVLFSLVEHALRAVILYSALSDAALGVSGDTLRLVGLDLYLVEGGVRIVLRSIHLHLSRGAENRPPGPLPLSRKGEKSYLRETLRLPPKGLRPSENPYLIGLLGREDVLGRGCKRARTQSGDSAPHSAASAPRTRPSATLAGGASSTLSSNAVGLNGLLK